MSLARKAVAANSNKEGEKDKISMAVGSLKTMISHGAYELQSAVQHVTSGKTQGGIHDMQQQIN